MATVKERVQRGVEWLDENKTGWDGDLAILNMDDMCSCVLGQVYGSFAVGLTILVDNTNELASDYGFDWTYGRKGDTRRLQTQWEKVIGERKGGTTK